MCFGTHMPFNSSVRSVVHGCDGHVVIQNAVLAGAGPLQSDPPGRGYLPLGEREGGPLRQNMFQSCQSLLCAEVKTTTREGGGGASAT